MLYELSLYSLFKSFLVFQVRKGGHQTIFGTVNMHGSSFAPAVWRVAVWVVLFPLLDDVKACYLKVLRKVFVVCMWAYMCSLCVCIYHYIPYVYLCVCELCARLCAMFFRGPDTRLGL